MNIAIVGATGNVGRKIIEVLENKNFPISELFLIASSKSEGKKINFKDKELTVIDLEKFDFSKVKIAFFAAGSDIAEKWAYKVAEKTIVIDNSKFFRKDPDIPLIVPEVNSKELIKVKNKNIIANNIGICFFKILLSENCLPAKAELIKIINKGNIVHRTARTNNPF